MFVTIEEVVATDGEAVDFNQLRIGGSEVDAQGSSKWFSLNVSGGAISDIYFDQQPLPGEPNTPHPRDNQGHVGQFSHGDSLVWRLPLAMSRTS